MHASTYVRVYGMQIHGGGSIIGMLLGRLWYTSVVVLQCHGARRVKRVIGRDTDIHAVAGLAVHG